jgi:hypothetical protein
LPLGLGHRAYGTGLQVLVTSAEATYTIEVAAPFTVRIAEILAY